MTAIVTPEMVAAVRELILAWKNFTAIPQTPEPEFREKRLSVWCAVLSVLERHERTIEERDEERRSTNKRIIELGHIVARLIEERDTARAELADLQRTFDLQWKADQRAIKQWQEAHPGNDMVWPDRCNMVVWLLDRYKRALRAATARAYLEAGFHAPSIVNAITDMDNAVAALDAAEKAEGSDG